MSCLIFETNLIYIMCNVLLLLFLFVYEYWTARNSYSNVTSYKVSLCENQNPE